MEAYRHGRAHLAHPPEKISHLTKLYTDAKKSATTNININPFAAAHQETPEQFWSLQRKFRIQKDRFITWGLAWTDDTNGPDGNIDESVAKAGLTEIVESVLSNVREVINELENVRTGVVRPGETVKQPLPFDESRYTDLLNDLTTSNDTLYDLSISRKALARGEHPTFSAGQEATQQAAGKPSSSTPRSAGKTSSIAESDLTLVNPLPFLRPTLSPYAGLPPRIELSALRLPEERPPPYESIGVPIATRLVGQLVRSRASESVQTALGSNASEVSVLVEYANYDSTYQHTGVPPPLQRLEALSTAFMPMRAESQHNISLLGYFEDPHEPRIGLVYDLPYSVQNRLHATAISSAETLAPLSLLNLIRKAKPLQPTSADVDPPPLEARFKLALRLTEQLRTLHLNDLAHGNINSSSVIFAMTSNEASSRRLKCLKSPIWASFDVFSKSSVEGRGRPTSLNIYRHPHDHPYPSQRDLAADIRFDMYSLALILLEVGIWQSLGDMFKPKYSLADFKLRLEKLWSPKLASRCGTAYMRAVQILLQAADPGEVSGLTTEGIYDGVFVQLQRCCILDVEIEEASDGPEMASYLAELSTSRRQLPASPVPQAERAVQQPSEIEALERTQSNSSTAQSSFSRLSSFSNLTGASAGNQVAPIRRRPVPQRPSTTSLEQFRPKKVVAGSFQDFKRKVVIIQQKWRERSRLCRDAATSAATSAANMQSTLTKASDAVAKIRPKLLEFPLLDIPQAIRDDWEYKTAVKLARLCTKALKGSPESSSICLTSYGETPETARPTYHITCRSTQKVKQVLKKHFRCDPRSCYVIVDKGQITRCRKARRESAAQQAVRSMVPRFEQEPDAGNPDYQPQPMCGASIGAYRDESHLPPVSFGGLVNVDGRAYGMSVHHMLEADESDDEDYDDDEDDDDDSSSVLSMDDSTAESLESEDDSTVRQPSTLSDTSLDEDLQAEGDVAGITPGDGADIEITQPALDDAISLNLHADEEDDDDEDSGVDEDHILSYKLGQVHASSGLKRSAFHSTETGYRGISSSLPQEIDWALLELLPPRVHPYNVIRGGRKFCSSPPSSRSSSSQDCFPVSIKTSSELAGAKVHCLGRTSGLASGVISSSMELLKLQGRSTFSASWTAHGGFGVGGDSGAWVISSDGKVCGHVLAERSGRTYICPMDLLFEDIRTTLGVGEVALPTLRATKRESNRKDESAALELESKVARMNLGDNRPSSRGGGTGGGVPVPSSTFMAKPKRSTAVRIEGEMFAPPRARGGEALRSAG